MSEIPFVNQLGDALDAAIAARAPARRRVRLGRRRYLAVALAALAVAGGGAAVADMLSDPAELGLGGIACYSGPGKSGSVAVVGTGDLARSPVEICGDAMASEGLTEADLVACGHGVGVSVVRRAGAGTCRRLGMVPLPVAYEASRERVRRLTERAVALERSADCIPPAEMARRLRALLADAGWTGWRVVVRGGEGPCGRLSGIGGSDVRLLTNMDAGRRTIGVTGGMPMALEEMLFGSESLGVRLIESSGERCFTLAELEEHARRLLAPTGRAVTFRVRPVPPDYGIGPPRGRLYERGCAVSSGPFPLYGDGRIEIGVGVFLKR